MGKDDIQGRAVGVLGSRRCLSSTLVRVTAYKASHAQSSYAGFASTGQRFSSLPNAVPLSVVGRATNGARP
jgi:hypothetical protein